MNKERRPPFEVAQHLWRSRYPSARVLFCGGSVVRGEGYPLSDLDVVVLFDNVAAAWREAFVFEDWPVEVFGHDLETLAYFANEDCKRGRPSLPQMIAEAVCIPESTPYSESVQVWARSTLAEQPGPPSPEVLAADRYWITDLLDDLRDERPDAELLAVACKLHPMVYNFVLRSRGLWLGSGKTLPRLLERAAPDLYSSIEQAFSLFFRTGERTDLIRVVQLVLAPLGGEIFDGFRSEAPASSRTPGGIPLR